MKNKLVYFECDIEGHDSNLLNQVCIDTSCKNRGLLCLFCQYHNHKGHEVRPLRIFLNEYQSNYKKFEEIEMSSAEKDNKAILESYENIHEFIKLFQEIINKQIDNLKNDLQNQIALRKNILQESSYEEGTISFQKALSSVLNNECTSSEEQINYIKILLSKVNSSTMSIEFKDKKQIQYSKESKHRIQEIEQAKNKITICMSRITDELVLITKQVSDIVYDSADLLLQIEKPDKIIKPNSPPKQIEQTRSVIKAIPQKISTNKKQMEKMFKGNQPDIKFDEQSSYNMDDLFNSQWKDESKQKQNLKNESDKIRSENYAEIHSKENGNKQISRGNSKKSFDEFSESDSSVERKYGKKIGKKRECGKQKKMTTKKKEINDLIDEDEEYPENKKSEQILEFQEGSNNQNKQNDQFFDCSLSKQQNFSSSYTQQEINLDVKVGVKFKAHDGIAKDVIFLDEQRLATCSYDRQIKIWDIVEKKLLSTLKGHEGRIMQIKYSKKHNLIGSVGKDKLAIIWKDHSYKQQYQLSGHKDNVMSIEFVDDRNLVITGGSDKQLKVWCILSGKQLFKIDDLVDNVFQITYDPLSELVYTGGYQHVFIYAFQKFDKADIKKNDEESIRIRSQLSLITSFQAHEDNINMIQPIKVKTTQYFVTCSDDKTLKLWDFDKLEVIQTIQEDTEISAFCFFEKLGILVISMWGYLGGGRSSFYDFSDFTKIQDVDSINTGTTSLKMNEQQNKLVSSHENGEIQLYYLNY